MTDSAPRCPSCANVLKLEPTFWERIGLRSTKVRCPTCHTDCDPRDADMMGSAFWHWAEAFRKELTCAIETLPILSEAALDHALGMHNHVDIHMMPCVEELARTCMRHQRPVLIEMARGRDATLDVAVLEDTAGKVEAVAVLGTASHDKGGREWEQLIARSGPTHFVLYNHPGKAGAESRVKQAIEAKGKTQRVGVTPRAAAMMQSDPIPAKRPQHA